MIKILRVILWNTEIGRLAWDPRRRLSYFTYHPDFVKKGLNIAPLDAPIQGRTTLLPVWGEDDKLYQKLPAFVADSLPDAWGNQLFDVWRQQNHLSGTDVTPLDKLSFIGKRGMGALEFLPEVSDECKVDKISIQSLATLAERIFVEKEKVQILPDESITLQSLLAVGTSAGGRQPKAIIAINRNTGEIRSGQIAGLPDYDYFLLKFGNAQYCSAELEMVYYELATHAGINMMPSRLYTIDGHTHFLTQRFDRKDGKKLYTQTLAAICPGADSYEQLIDVCRKLHLQEADCLEVFRRMVFNILANNTDDHNKNFSFIMNEQGEWRLSPAYDMTYIINVGGVLPEKNHCLFLRAKLSDFTLNDVLDFAADVGIRKPETIIAEVVESLQQFRKVAVKYGVSSIWIGRIETTLHEHLVSWGYDTDSKESITFEIDGITYTDVHLEQTYKGNYHLFVTVNGMERKFVIGKNKSVHAKIDSIGVSNVTVQELKELVKQLF